MDATHYLNSSLREKILEHLFVGEVLKKLWSKGVRNMEVLKAEVDSGGYDVVISCNDIIRYIQLKGSKNDSNTSKQNINLLLGSKPGGCVVWMFCDPNTLDLGPFYWFGASPGESLPNIENFPVAKHTKGDANGVKNQRQNIRIIKKSQFEKLNSIDDVIEKLFGL